MSRETNLVYAEETQRDDVGTPGGITVARAVTECDAATVEDDCDVERTLALREGLRGHDCRAQVETCDARGQIIFMVQSTETGTDHIHGAEYRNGDR